jgi:RNA polymerase sigma-70 factor (sigma-E family)
VDVERRDFTDFAKSALPYLRRRAYQLCGTRDEADDLVQSTLLRVYLRWPWLQRRGQLTAYAGTALLHTFLNSRRELRWSREVLYAEPPDCAAELSGSLIESRALLLPALRRLGKAQRAVVILRFIADLPVQQVADILGISAATVTSQTSRALARLRTALSDQD